MEILKNLGGPGPPQAPVTLRLWLYSQYLILTTVLKFHIYSNWPESNTCYTNGRLSHFYTLSSLLYCTTLKVPGVRIEGGLNEENGRLALNALELDDQRVRQPQALAIQLVAPRLEALSALHSFLIDE